MRCDICAISDGKGTSVRRFALYVPVKDEGRTTTRGAGTLFLCSRCYSQTAGKRTAAAKRGEKSRPIAFLPPEPKRDQGWRERIGAGVRAAAERRNQAHPAIAERGSGRVERPSCYRVGT